MSGSTRPATASAVSSGQPVIHTSVGITGKSGVSVSMEIPGQPGIPTSVGFPGSGYHGISHSMIPTSLPPSADISQAGGQQAAGGVAPWFNPAGTGPWSSTSPFPGTSGGSGQPSSFPVTLNPYGATQSSGQSSGQGDPAGFFPTGQPLGAQGQPGMGYPFGYPQPSPFGFGYPTGYPRLPGSGGFSPYGACRPPMGFPPGYGSGDNWGFFEPPMLSSFDNSVGRGSRRPDLPSAPSRSSRKREYRRSAVATATNDPRDQSIRVASRTPVRQAREAVSRRPQLSTRSPSLSGEGGTSPQSSSHGDRESSDSDSDRDEDCLSVSVHGDRIDEDEVSSADEPESEGPAASSTGHSVPDHPSVLLEQKEGSNAVTSLRSLIYRILGHDQCPPPSGPLRESRSSSLRKKLNLPTERSVDRSLPESDLVTSTLAHMQALRSGQVSTDDAATEEPPSNKGVFSVSHIGGFKPSNYAVHNNQLSAMPSRLEDNFDRVLYRPGVDTVLLRGKDKEKTERLMRLAVHTLSYADWQSSALFDVAKMPPGEEREDLLLKIAQGLFQSHEDSMALILSALHNFVLSRRRSVLQHSKPSLKQSHQDRLLRAPISGPTLFGGAVQPLIEELAKDVRNVTVAVTTKGSKGQQQPKAAPPPPVSSDAGPPQPKKGKYGGGGRKGKKGGKKGYFYNNSKGGASSKKHT